MNYLISVVTVCYNDSLGLSKTINSLRNQNATFEYIIIDGGSSDSTKEVITQNSDIISDWISEKDSGIYNAMNKGLSRVKGNYVIFLNADDTLSHNFINTIYNLIERESPDFIYSKTRAQIDDHRIEKIPKEIEPLKKYKEMPFAHPGLVVHRNVYEEIGNFNEKYLFAGDYDWVLRLIAAQKFKGILNSSSFANYSVGGKGNSSKSVLETYDIYKKTFKNNKDGFSIILRGFLGLFYVKYLLWLKVRLTKK